MNKIELLSELQEMSMEPLTSYDIAVTISVEGLNGLFTVCPIDLKCLMSDLEWVEYTAVEWHNIPCKLHDDVLDYDEIEAWARMSEGDRELAEHLIDHCIVMSYEDASEKVESCFIFEGSEEDYARFEVEETMNIDEMPLLIRSNINWGDVFIDLSADGNVHKIGQNRFLVARF